MSEITLVSTKEVVITCNEIPQPYARCISPFDDNKLVKDKIEFPFKQRVPVDFKIIVANKVYDIKFSEYSNDPEGFKYDGASIPRSLHSIIGENGNPYFLIPAYFHDIFCNNKDLLERDRKLSSLVFYKLLLACKTPLKKAKIMYLAVDEYQSHQDW